MTRTENARLLQALDDEEPLTDGAVRDASLSAIAIAIGRRWEKPYFGAKPYVEAMLTLHSDDQAYGADSAKEIALYFLANATTWRGADARIVKSELRRRFDS